MTKTAALFAFFFLFVAAPASAQEADLSPAHTALEAASSQHRAGVALMVTGVSANIGGGIGALVSLFRSVSAVCIDGPCGPTSDPNWGQMLAGSLALSAVGLVTFFVGLGLDVGGRIGRTRAARDLALTLAPDGIALSF